MAAGGSPGNVKLGPGRVYYAPLGTAEPVSGSAALPSAWQSVGYTSDGTTFTTQITSEGIDVAEELDPIAFFQTARSNQITFTMVEATVKRLALAYGAGAARADSAAGFGPPDPAAIVGVMLVWDKLDVPDATNSRILFRQCTPSGSIAMAHQKAPNKSAIPVTFDIAKPSTAAGTVPPTSTGLEPFWVFPNASGQVA